MSRSVDNEVTDCQTASINEEGSLVVTCTHMREVGSVKMTQQTEIQVAKEGEFNPEEIGLVTIEVQNTNALVMNVKIY